MKAVKLLIPVILVLAVLSAMAFSCAILFTLFSQDAPVKPAFKDVPYASQSSAQKLDIYLPENSRGPYPVVVWVHGAAGVVGIRPRKGRTAWSRSWSTGATRS